MTAIASPAQEVKPSDADHATPLERERRRPAVHHDGAPKSLRRRTHDRSGTTRVKRLVALAAVALFAVACTPAVARPRPRARPASPSAARRARRPRRAEAAPSAAAAAYNIGYSNGGGVGNGFREEQVCTAKAEALASGQVAELTTIHRNTDAAGQLQDIRDLIAADVDAIVFNPNNPDALNPALEEAKAAGIKTISVDAYVTNPDTYNLYNNQIEYARPRREVAVRAARWPGQRLVHPRHRRQPGRQRPRHRVQAGARQLPRHHHRPERRGRPHRLGSGQGHPAGERVRLERRRMTTSRASGPRAWTPRSSTSSRPPARPYVPIVGADLGAFVDQLLDDRLAGLTGAAVTNTAAVGGAGVGLALKLLNGETLETDTTAPQPNTVLLEPVLADNVTRRRQGAPRVVAGRRARPALAARSPDRRATPPTPPSRPSPARARASSLPQPDHARGRRHRRRPRRQPERVDDHHRDRSPARGDRRREDVRRGRGAAVRVAGRPPGRGPCADGRQRRRQEHPRQDPDRCRPARRRHHRHPRPRRAPSTRPARRAAAGSSPSTRSRRSSRTSTSGPTCA